MQIKIIISEIPHLKQPTKMSIAKKTGARKPVKELEFSFIMRMQNANGKGQLFKMLSITSYPMTQEFHPSL